MARSGKAGRGMAGFGVALCGKARQGVFMSDVKISKSRVQALVEVFAALKIGELVTYGDIRQIVGKDPQGDGRSACTIAVKRCSKKRGILIRNLRSKGYYRASIDERPEYAASKREHVDRALLDGMIAVTHIEEKEFDRANPEQLRRLVDEQARIGVQLLVGRQLDKKKKLPEFKLNCLEDFSHIGEKFSQRMKKSNHGA